MTRYLITGGAGFIGSELVRHLVLDEPNAEVLNVDKLTYAGNLDSLQLVAERPNYEFRQLDIGDAVGMARCFAEFQPEIVFNLAAESHVDHSIASPEIFLQTNILGTFNLLEAARAYWTALPSKSQDKFRFLHVSTDEVYGSLGPEGSFSETSPYKPRNPYSASKASADHLVRTWHETYGLPTIITNSSNNYGHYQFPEKLIPRTILRFLSGKKAEIFGDGFQIRDWLHVSDHITGLLEVVQQGAISETYMIGGENQFTVLQVVELIADFLNELHPPRLDSYRNRIEFYPERPGNDRRYSVDASKLRRFGWSQTRMFEEGLRQTVLWYLENKAWWHRLL